MKIAHPDGVWMRNTAQYRCHDHETSTFYEPGEATKALATAFTRAQSAIVLIADPTLSEAIQAKLAAKLAEQNAEAEADRQALSAAADALIRADNERMSGDQAGLPQESVPYLGNLDSIPEPLVIVSIPVKK